MVCLQKLILFLNENRHDIIDFYILEEYVKWLKIVSRRDGEIYMLNVMSFRIKVEDTRNVLDHRQKFVLYETEASSGAKERYKTIIGGESHRFVFMHGNHIGESLDTWYSAQNVPKTNNYCLYMVIDLEWFYENVYIVSSEVHQQQNLLEVRCARYIRDTITSISAFVRDERYVIKGIMVLLTKYESMVKDLNEGKQIFSKISGSLQHTLSKMKQIDELHADDISFKSVAHRQYYRKKLLDKKEQLVRLKSAAIHHLSFYNSKKWNYLVQSVVIARQISSLIVSIHQCVEEASAL